MTKFEKLLLQSGNPDLICAFIEEYESVLSRDFMENFQVYRERIVKKLSETKLSGILSMGIQDFLEVYGKGIISPHCQAILQKAMRQLDVCTVKDLLEKRKSDILRVHNLGKKSIIGLMDTLENLGWHLLD